MLVHTVRQVVEQPKFWSFAVPSRYSKSTLGDKFSNLLGEMNNAVPLILHQLHPKQHSSCSRNVGLKGHFLRSGRMWAWIVLMHHLWI
jgi:hypothetical protein